MTKSSLTLFTSETLQSHTTSYTSSSSSSGTMACEPNLSEFLWTLFSFLLYSCVLLYISYQTSRQSYAGSRNTGMRLRFPENMNSMLYVWLTHALLSAVTAFLAYLHGGGWTHPTTIVLSLYLVMEVIHYGWMTNFFRFAAYVKALFMKLFMLGIQTYMLMLYFLLEPVIALLYLIPLGVSFYEAVVNVIVLIRSCRTHMLLATQREHSRRPEESRRPQEPETEEILTQESA